MKLFSVLLLTLFTAQSFAQSGTVERVKGSKAVVNFEGKTPKIGDVLSVGEGEEGGSSVGLRKRQHGLKYAVSLESDSTETTLGTSTTKTSASTTSIEFQYLRNFGSFEVGGGLTKINVDSDNDAISLAAIGQYNFTVNKPRNDVIPFARGDFRILMGKTRTFSISGTGLALGGGLYWFPFGEIFALDAGLSFLIDNYEVNTSPVKSKSKSTTTAITAGWRLYF